VASIGGKHLLEVIRKGLSFVGVTLSPAAVRITKRGDLHFGSSGSLRGLPYGVVIWREGGKIVRKGFIIDVP